MSITFAILSVAFVLLTKYMHDKSFDEKYEFLEWICLVMTIIFIFVSVLMGFLEVLS